MEDRDKTILVLGATGQQGGATARHLLSCGWRVRALVRDESRESAQLLQQQGAELVVGDFNQAASLRAAMEGIAGLFSVQTSYGEGGVVAEVQQGKLVARLAREVGIAHLVYSSVGGAERGSGIPHFEGKWQIEQHIHALGLPVTILRPAFFMSNFRYVVQPGDDGTLIMNLALRPETKLQMIAVDDIGAFAALAFEHPDTFIGKQLEIAGDELTPASIEEIFARVTGKPTSLREQSIEQLRNWSPESATMFEWLNQSGYQANIPVLRQLHPQLMTLEMWLRQSEW